MVKKILLLTLALIVTLALPLAGCTQLLNVTVKAPKDGATVNNSLVEVKGHVSDYKATVWVNEVAVNVLTNGNFSTNIELAEGENTIKVRAAQGKPDAWKKVVDKTITVTYVPPAELLLEITSPVDGDRLTESTFTVKGNVSDPEAKVIVNQVEAEVSEDGTFSAEVEFDEEGSNLIAVVAKLGDKTLYQSVTIDYSPE